MLKHFISSINTLKINIQKLVLAEWKIYLVFHILSKRLGDTILIKIT